MSHEDFAGWITACVAHYDCHRYVRRAVESLLAQTYPWVRVVVIHDGDARPPWPQLASIRDPRLVRFSLQENRGAYFCYEIARRATPDAYFMMQDADDWAAPERATLLLKSLRLHNSDLAVSAQPQFSESADGVPVHVSTRWTRLSNQADAERFVVQTRLSKDFKYRVPHAGLLRMAMLRDLGGYYGGLRVGWDTLLMNLVLMLGTVSWTPEPLYCRLLRSDSLTHSKQTGVDSEYATQVSRFLKTLYQECYSNYQFLLSGDISRTEFTSRVRYITTANVKPEEQLALDTYAHALRRQMR